MPALMLQGTASGVGKSVLAAGLCRLLARNGVRVAPFKPQNMSNNAAVALGGEIGRAQALQALACGLRPRVEMNPVLIKPEADEEAELIVLGKPAGKLNARTFREARKQLFPTIMRAFESLASEHDLVIVEGAGSPAEPNLLAGDIANMGFARAADAPVWLVGDIDRGGVFASFVGTLAVLPAEDRARVQAFVINKFRGRRALLDEAIQWLEQTTGKPVAGVVPWMELALPEEDAPYRRQHEPHARFRIAVIAYPRLSNHDDFDPLAWEADVELRFVRSPEALQPADLVILPGSKHVASDLDWLRARGFVPEIMRHLRYGGHLLGVCGGMQMLGRAIHDPHGLEGGSRQGLGLLPITTTIRTAKVQKEVAGIARWPHPAPVRGYEIHRGEIPADDRWFPFAARSEDGQVWGTWIHGLFANDAFRRAWLQALVAPVAASSAHAQRVLRSLDRLADALEEAIAPEMLAPFLERAR